MNLSRFIIPLLIITAAAGVYMAISRSTPLMNPASNQQTDMANLQMDAGTLADESDPLAIDSLRAVKTPGSDLALIESLPAGSNYSRSIVSYESEGNTIYALLTVPLGVRPPAGWPVIVFNHGYIPPAQYRTTERYIAYTDAFSRNGYILIRPDYRGHGNSEGTASGGYGSNAYTIDVLNAVASIKRFKEADPARIGMWGHSMGGHITLRSMVVSKDIKAGVIWAGVVASYPDLLNNWRRRNPNTPPPGAPSIQGRGWRQQLVTRYGEPENNPTFWNSISANTYLREISGPLQLHHGTADTSVPVAFSEKLDGQMREAGQLSELYVYDGDDHNIGANLTVALNRSVEFFDTHVKNAGETN